MVKALIPFYYKITNLYWMLGRKKSRKCAKSITWHQEQFQIFATFIALFNTRFVNCNFRYIFHYGQVNDGWISHLLCVQKISVLLLYYSQSWINNLDTQTKGKNDTLPPKQSGSSRFCKNPRTGKYWSVNNPLAFLKFTTPDPLYLESNNIS